MQHFRSVNDVPDLSELIEKALAYKRTPRCHSHLGTGKTVGLIFFNPSTRTRISTQIAAQNLGMQAIVFNVDKDGWSLEFGDDVVMNGLSVEHVREAAPVLGSYFDVLALRSFPALSDRQEDESELVLQQFVRFAGIPVISLESATLHPLQSFADLLTIRELFAEKRRPRVALTWAPHGKALPHCVANSFSQWITTWGEADLVIAQPPGYVLNEKYTAGATVTDKQSEALDGADFVYVKNWSAMEPYGTVQCVESSWMLTLDKLKRTNSAKVMHCLPVRRNLELGAEVLDSAHSVVVRQAANRVWAAQAVLATLLELPVPAGSAAEMPEKK